MHHHAGPLWLAWRAPSHGRRFGGCGMGWWSRPGTSTATFFVFCGTELLHSASVYLLIRPADYLPKLLSIVSVWLFWGRLFHSQFMGSPAVALFSSSIWYFWCCGALYATGNAGSGASRHCDAVVPTRAPSRLTQGHNGRTPFSHLCFYLL